MNKQQIGIAMSGGVDSTACALLLREQYQVKGFFMHLGQPDFLVQKRQVESIAERLDIELQVIDLQQEFAKAVLDYFSLSYYQGLTPNPCVVCNKEIKFGLFLEAIVEAGMEKMATGHYVRLTREGDHCRLLAGLDPKKDQSYFLARLSQDQLRKVVFPLGEMTKEEVYRLVEDHGFTHFRGLESQDVCFLEDKNVAGFLEKDVSTEDSGGEIVSTGGKLLGYHQGLYRYTIGQRRGLGISSEAPLYVVGLDKSNNRVIVGSNEELFQKNIEVKEIHWLSSTPPDPEAWYTVRIRYSHRGAAARLVNLQNDRTEIHFQEPQRAVTPGQFAVIYRDMELLGSGVIV